jgi:sugar lactone lactonase YvrE
MVRVVANGLTDASGVAVAADGTMYVAEGAGADRIRAISPNGVVSTLAGGERGFADGIAAAAQFNTPSALAIDADGTIYVADTGNNAIRRVAPDGRVSTVAGDGVAGYRDGAAAQARFNGPIGVAIDGSGRLFVADTYNDRIRVIDRNGTVTTIAGGEPGALDGLAVDARFDTPCGVAVARDGTLYVADTGNDAVRAISPIGLVTTIDTAAVESLREPIGVAIDARDGIFVTDDRGRIVEVSGVDSARVVAGSQPGFRDGRADDAQFRGPMAVASPQPGRLIVADTGNGFLRAIAATSIADVHAPSAPASAPHFEAEAFALQPLLWPLDPQYGPFEIAGTLGEARAGGASRFHTGLDVRADEGTEVLAVRDGIVASPSSTGDFASLNEWLRIGPVGYVHVRVGRKRNGDVIDASRFVATRDERGRVMRMRVKRGARFATGETIATVNPFNHVHLNVGWPGEEYNPLLFRLVQFTDTVPPTIAPGGVRLYDADGRPFARRINGRLIVSGLVQIVVDAWDQVDGNRPERRLGLYALGYEVLNGDGSPAPGFERAIETIRFDRLRSADAPRLVYAPGSGIAFYGERRTRFLYVVTNTFRDGVATSGVWDTTKLPPGDYTLRVRARDRSGNEALANRDVAISIVAPE